MLRVPVFGLQDQALRRNDQQQRDCHQSVQDVAT